MLITAVCKNKVNKGIEVGLAVCENDVSAMAEEQTVYLNKPFVIPA